MTTTDLPPAGDTTLPNLQGTHFQLAPEWSHVAPSPDRPTIAMLAYVFCEPVRVVRGGAWLAGDEIEYLKDDDEIPASLLDPILLHLAEVHERKYGWTLPTRHPSTFASAITWLCLGERTEVWPKFNQWFTADELGGYVFYSLHRSS